MASLYTARKCFQDNLQNHIDQNNSPDAYNLSQGLLSMVEALEEIQIKLREIEYQISQLRQ